MANGNAYKNQFSAEDIINKLFQKGLMDENNTGFLQTLIDNSLIYNENVPFWSEAFLVEGQEYPANLADSKINPAWTVRSFQTRMTPMADAMAPLSEVSQLDNEDYEERTGSIYQYGKGLYQTSMGKIELQAKLRALNIQDQTILGGYVKSVADAIKSQNSRLSNLSAQTLSKGGAYSNVGQGFDGVRAIQSSYIPSSNFKNAGTKVWSASDCDIPTQIQEIIEAIKTEKGLADDFQFMLDIPIATVKNVLLKNAKVIAEVNRYLRLEAPDKVIVVTAGASGIDTDVITVEQLVGYSRSTLSKIPPIHVVAEKQSYQGFETTPVNVSGWEANKVVLRPIGYAGVVAHAQPNDIAMYQSGELNDSVSVNIAKAQGFLYVVNKTVNNGMFKSYHIDVIGRYAPVLNQIQNHIVIDIATADA